MKFECTDITPRITQLRMDVLPQCKTNCFVIHGRKASYIIDTGFGSHTAQVTSRLLYPEQERFIINTHFHWDHWWGNDFIEGAKVVQHHSCKELTEKYRDEMYNKYRNYAQGEVSAGKVDITFTSRLELNGEILLFHSPGHTEDGISAFFYEDRALFVGDNFGDDDAHILPVLDCGKALFAESLQHYRALQPQYICSGHNEVRDIKMLDEMIHML